MSETIEKRNDLGQFFVDMARAVVEGSVMLHDDRANLMTRKELTESLMSNSSKDIQDLFANQLFSPIEVNENGVPLFHAAICLDFLVFLEKLEQGDFPLRLQQSIAETYQNLFWSLLSDMEYEVDKFREERGREPSEFELARLRVINDWAVSNSIIRIEDGILTGK